MKIDGVNLDEYLTNDFSKDCPKLKNLSKKFINFDEVREKLYSQLRSVDFIEIYDNRVYLYEITTLKEQLKQVKDSKSNIKELLKEEYRGKLFESLFLLSFIKSINDKKVILKVLICEDDCRKNIHAYLFLEGFLKSLLQKEDKAKILCVSQFLKTL